MNYTSSQLILGYSLVFVSSWVYATNCVLNRALRGINPSVIMFWHGVLGFMLAIVAVGIDHFIGERNTNGLQLFNYSSDVYWLMLGAALVDTITVFSMTIAFQSDRSGFVSLFSYLTVLYAFVADSLIFQESFTWVEMVAAILILVVTIFTSLVKLRESNRAKQLEGTDEFLNAENLITMNDSRNSSSHK